MARQKTQVEYSNFTKGFITEASPLTFPENASLDEENMNINRDGSRQRRFGLTWADDHDIRTYTTDHIANSGEATASYTWRSAGNDGDVNVGVLQLGRTIYFYDLDSENPAGAYLNTSTFSSAQVPSPLNEEPFSFTTAYGKLLVAVGTDDVWVYTMTGPSTFVRTSYNLKIRDRFGVDDGYAVDYRSTGGINNAHWYNLRNQGWPLTTMITNAAYLTTGAISGNPHFGADPIAFTKANVNVYPSNADLFWACACDNIGASATIANLGTYNPGMLIKLNFGTTHAPQGHYILDMFARGADRIAQSGIVGLPTDATTGGITELAGFAGRIWYGITETGITTPDDNSPSLGSMIFYSRASEDESKWSECHSSNDPTVEDYNDPLATDGGFISIPEVGQVYGLAPLGESLFVLGSNGVWEIFGGDTGFSAQVQSVAKVTDVGASSSNSIITGENVVAYWTESGIYAVTLDQTTLRGIATNITETTIQDYYDDIPVTRRQYARGHYDDINKQATWLFSLEDLGSNFYYDKELVFDTKTGSFTKRSIAPITKDEGHGPYPTAYLGLRQLYKGITQVDVTASAVTVTAGGEDVYVVESDAEQATKSSTMYWTAEYNGLNELYRLGGYINFDFYDWSQIYNTETEEYGADSPAYLLTGYITGGDSSVDKWMPYVTTRLKRTESSFSIDDEGVLTMVGESSCMLQAQWEWTNSALSGRWSRPQQTYKLPRLVYYDINSLFNFDVVNTRSKIRGKGKAISLKFSSEPGKDMFIYGWGMDVVVKESK